MTHVASTEDTPTYSKVLALAGELAPSLFGADSVLVQRSDDPRVREYQQKAEALSKRDGIAVDPLELIDHDIAEYETLVETDPEKHLLNKRLESFQATRQKLLKRKYTETQLILRDVYSTRRNLPGSETGQNYREFQLPYGNILRLRILHPDPPEYTTGADVIYERYFLEDKSALCVVKAFDTQRKLGETA